MEVTKAEIGALQEVVNAVEETLKTLDQLDLSLVGGGMGDIIL